MPCRRLAETWAVARVPGVGRQLLSAYAMLIRSAAGQSPIATHWAHTALLSARYPKVRVDPDVLYVDEGTVLTSAGKSAAMDLCLHIVRTDHGAAVANTLARSLIVPPHRPGGQAQFIPAPVSHGTDHLLAELLAWVTARLDQPLTVQDLARHANISTRNLTRHFRAVTGTSPLQWLLIQRVNRAQEILETTDASVEHIAARSGLGTGATLRRHFNRLLGIPPEAYRRTFRDDKRARSRGAIGAQW